MDSGGGGEGGVSKEVHLRLQKRVEELERTLRDTQAVLEMRAANPALMLDDAMGVAMVMGMEMGGGMAGGPHPPFTRRGSTTSSVYATKPSTAFSTHPSKSLNAPTPPIPPSTAGGDERAGDGYFDRARGEGFGTSDLAAFGMRPPYCTTPPSANSFPPSTAHAMRPRMPGGWAGQTMASEASKTGKVDTSITEADKIIGPPFLSQMERRQWLLQEKRRWLAEMRLGKPSTAEVAGVLSPPRLPPLLSSGASLDTIATPRG